MKGLLFLCFLPLCYSLFDERYLVLFNGPLYPYGEDSEKLVNTENVTVVRKDENTSCMNGFVEMYDEIAGDLILELIVCKESNGKFEPVNSHTICDLCKELGNPDSDYHPYFKDLGFLDQCPIQKGIHEIRDFAVDAKNFGLNSQHCGRYETEFTMYRKTGDNCAEDRERIACIKIDVLVDTAE